jgi:hypothetical protein
MDIVFPFPFSCVSTSLELLFSWISRLQSLQKWLKKNKNPNIGILGALNPERFPKGKWG